MRILAFVLAFIVLALSCQPCADGDYSMNATKAKVTHSNIPQQQNKQDHNDACSPFCHCTCCAGFSINHYSISISCLSIPSNKTFTSFFPADIIEISFPIWQPPQLVA
ncbi:DUF6660 family protein [Niastella vici]|uniref:DUF6660 family protein n=1 Tax=Niastella vici TaxID=1703345 RepID=UPI001180943B|nr:DUF6660 family protein [Niastella vici]